MPFTELTHELIRLTEEVVLRSMPGKVNVNGHARSWAVLDDQDEIKIGDLALTIQIRRSSEGEAKLARVLNERRMAFRLPVEAPGRLLDHPSLPDVHSADVLVVDIGDGGAKVLTSVASVTESGLSWKLRLHLIEPPSG